MQESPAGCCASIRAMSAPGPVPACREGRSEERVGAAAQTQIAKATLLTVTAFVQSEDDIVLNRRARALAQPERQALREATPRMSP